MFHKIVPGGSGSLRTPDREIRNSTFVRPGIVAVVVVVVRPSSAVIGWTMSSWTRCPPLSSSSSVSDVKDQGIDFSKANDQFGGATSTKMV